MSEQQSQKQGLKSSAQKEERAREPYAPLPASNPVAGAFAGSAPASQSDEDLSLSLEEKTRKDKNDDREK
jgi:hypothetical protein